MDRLKHLPVHARVLWTLLFFVLLQFGAAQWAQAQTTDFDHSSTGFVLNGQHQSARCESCHLKGVFKGTPKDCVSCHGWNNPRASMVMPTNHIPTANISCEICHAASQSQFIDATLTFSHALVTSISCQSCHSSNNPHPNVKANPTDATHQAVLASNQSCDKCHTTTQFTGPKVPSNHIPTAAVSCGACHVSSDYSVMPAISAIHANAQSTSGNCQQCHSAAGVAAYSMPTMTPPLVGPVAGHIAMNGQGCETCHVGPGSSLQLPVQDTARFTNSRFSHSGISSGCATCHGPNVNIGSFFGVTGMVLMPPSVGPGATSHIPGFATCETCHAANMPTGQLPVNATLPTTGTGFMAPAPTAAMIHAGVSGNCSSCHDTNFFWLGVNQYVSAKSAPYSGFQSRPTPSGSTYAIADASHPTTGDCSSCHSVGSAFSAPVVPGNHIPVASGAACIACHKGATFSVMPALADIHANAPSTSSNCAQCHATGPARTYSTSVMTVVSTPAGHIADVGSVGCEGCHVGAGSSIAATPVPNGAKFSGSAFSHTNISTGCATCHGQGINSSSFYGVGRIVVMPPSSAPGIGSHLPTATTCESCHTAIPAVLVPATAPSTAAGTTGFYSPAPTATAIHNNNSVSCSSCHETNYVWTGMERYATPTGFQTRPQLTSSGTYFVQDAAHPVAGDCSNCHTQVDYSVSQLPTNHIPTNGAACSACHRSTDFSVMPTVADIHAAASTTCTDCHSATNAARYNTLASMKPAIVAPPANHIESAALGNPGQGCDVCHVGNGSSIAALPVPDGAHFSGSLFSHTGITTGCEACHGATIGANTFAGVTPKNTASLNPGHVPTPGVTTCETCHVGVIPPMLVPASGMPAFSGAQFSHTSITNSCDTCHGQSITGASFYGITRIVVLPPTTNGGHIPSPVNNKCETCHASSIPAGLVAGVAANTTLGTTLFNSGHLSSDVIHTSVAGSCNTCHEKGSAWLDLALYPSTPGSFVPNNSAQVYTGFQARPFAGGTPANYSLADAGHPTGGDCSQCHGGFSGFTALSLPSPHIPFATGASCAACHGDFSALPTIANIHANAPSTSTGCATCHSAANASNFSKNATRAIVAPPTGHIDMGSLGCEGCHISAGGVTSSMSLPVSNAAKFSASAFSHVGIALTCGECHGPNVTAGTFFGVLPKTAASLVSPPHVPVSNNVSCDLCHVGSTPVGLIPSTGATTGMTSFAGAQYSHAGIATGVTCATCHGVGLGNSSFYGVTKLVVLPPTTAGGHIPSPVNATCDTCHNIPRTALVPAVSPNTTLGSTLFNSGRLSPDVIHTGVTNGSCSTCHEKGMTWLDLNLYPSSPASFISGVPSTIYTGFQARPFSGGTPSNYSLANGAHPGSGDCSQCHAGFSGFSAPNLPVPHIPFATGALCTACHGDYSAIPTISKIHANTPANSTCADCHSTTNAATYSQNVTRAVVAPPSNHIAMQSGVVSGPCEQCHVASNSSVTLPIPDTAKFKNSAFSHANVATTGCASCHNVAAGTFFGVNPKSLSNLAPAHVPLVNSPVLGCEACHTNSIPATLIPLTGATGAMTSFAGAKYSHSGITTGCVTCHGQGITGATFNGISKIVVMPPSTTPGVNSHLPTTTTCESCHLGSTPTVLVPGVATATAPGSGFLAPNPTAAQIHAGTTGACSTCHDTNMVWMSMGQYPITTVAPFKGFQTRPQTTAGTFFVQDTVPHPATGECSNCHASLSDFTSTAMPANHIPIKTGAACTSCHTNVDFSVMPTIANIHLYAPSSTTGCAQCHDATLAANFNTMTTMKPPIVTIPAKHVDMGGLGCEACHVSAGGVTSSLSLPVSNTAKFTNSAYSHTNVTSGCANCHGSTVVAGTFAGVNPKTMVGLAPVHVPSSQVCETCHTSVPATLVALSGGVAPNTFAGGKFSHTGIVSGCSACHGAGIGNTSFYGVTKIVVLPATTATGGTNVHIPSPINAQCETCHLGSTPSALVPAVSTTTTLGATLFKSPTPTGAMIHTGITGSCNTCHENGLNWLDMSLYPGSPTSVIPGSNYTGFQTRPVAGGVSPSLADPSHPVKGDRDCSNCHGSTAFFNVTAKPSNHIPVNPASACTVCHTNITATNKDFSVMPTATSLTAIHANAPTPVTSGCAACHSAANAATYAIASAGFAIVAPDPKHVPFGTTACETCHVGSGSSMASGVVTNGAKFSGSLFSHTGITTGCATCHGAGISATSFTGVTAIVAIPASTTTFGASTHIPYTAACETCHSATVPSGLVSVTSVGTKFASPLTTGVLMHANSTSLACKTCHERGYSWLGMANYPRTPSALNLAVPTTAYNGFQTRPGATATTYGYTDAGHTGSTLDTGDCSLCHSGTTAFTGEGKPAGHMPTTVTTCTTCHAVAGDYSVAGLASLTALHTGVTSGAIVPATTANMISKTCGTCHTVGTGGTSGTAPFAGCTTQASCTSPPPIGYQPATTGLHPVHVPIGTTTALTVDCNGCHAAVTGFAGVNMKNSTMHTSVNGVARVLCMSCHESGLSFYGVTNLKVRPSGHHTGQDCGNSGCHTYNGGFRALQRPVMRQALGAPGSDRLRPAIEINKPSRGSLGNAFDHKNVVVGQCKTCHDGKAASGMPARHLMVSTSCDTCHRTSAWTPAQFNHNGVSPNTCLACHNGMGATGKPAGHFITSRSCDSCHKNMTWTPVMYQHISPSYKADPTKLTCVSCHVTNSEIIPRQMRGLNRTKPLSVGP